MIAGAKAIYEAPLEHGPLDTVRLRREARMSAESAKSRFDRALVELQVGLKVLPIGVALALFVSVRLLSRSQQIVV
jgi:hypothetical protein